MELRDLVLQRMEVFKDDIDKCLRKAAFARDDGNDTMRQAYADSALIYQTRLSELEWILSKL